MNRTCRTCKAPLPPRKPGAGRNRLYCKPSHMPKRRSAAYLARKRKRQVARAKERYRERAVVVEKRCSRCGDSFKTPKSNKRYCRARCAKKAAEAARRAWKRGDRHEGRESFTLLEIAERDDWTCGICREEVSQTAQVPEEDAPTIDHIRPLSLDGTHTRDNVQLAHFMCNAVKGARCTDLQDVSGL